MQDLHRLLADCARRGIRVTPRDAGLHVAPASALTPDLRAAIVANKAELLELLRRELDRTPGAAASKTPRSPSGGSGGAQCRGAEDSLSAPRSSRSPGGGTSKTTKRSPPARGCRACDNRRSVRVRGGPEWTCIRCHPVREDLVVEEHHAPEASLWEAWRERPRTPQPATHNLKPGRAVAFKEEACEGFDGETWNRGLEVWP